tara:strand:+ start:45 stop:560 length:516 start_codon:yes stop_codon:yes gene_type:complete
MTKEEKREKTRVRVKAWRLANPDKVKATNESRKPKVKVWREANKEKIAAQTKVYRKANNDKIVAHRKVSYKANKGKVIACNNGYRKSKELPYIIIYCIPNYNGKDNYVGITKNPFTRMINHKSQGKLNTEEYIELDKADTRAEAKKLEREYHNRGYHGIDGRLTNNKKEKI